MRIVFMGSPEFAVPSLHALMAKETVLGVVTQPDRPQGRGQKQLPSPIKKVALSNGVPVHQPERVRGNASFLADLRTLAPDLIVVVAFGQILPQEVLDLPRYGCINVHASLLPKYRGAAPIVWALANGERETGVTLMKMDAGMDTGAILLAKRIAIADSDTAGSLSQRLAELGAEVLAEGLTRLKMGQLVETPQDQSAASQAPKLRKEMGHIDFAQPAQRVHDFIRAMDPWPGAFGMLPDGTLRLFRTKVLSGRGQPGTVVGADREGLWIACEQGLVAAGELQRPGGKRMAAQAFLAGCPIPVGSALK